MKLTSLSLVALSVAANARFIEQHENQAVIVPLSEAYPQAVPVIHENTKSKDAGPHSTNADRLIEINAGEQRWVTEEQKWAIRRNGLFVMDITDHQDLGRINALKAISTRKPYPLKAVKQKSIFNLFKSLDKTNIQAHLEHFVTYHNRFYKSETGAASSKWLLSIINQTIVESGADEKGVTVETFEHPWGQRSIIVKIPGKSNGTVILGAHQDSVNHADPMNGRSPGADDDGSGTMTILEVLRVLLTSKDVVDGKAENPIEFHWYSAEEGGLLGSQEIFSAYEKEGKDVKAMLQQDMTGYTHLTKGDPVFGLMMDIMDEDLMNYLKIVIDTYSPLKWVETGCGPTCGSDHMSAIRAGFPAVFVIEAAFRDCDLKHLHGPDDLIKYLNFDHMIDHAEISLAFIYELAFANL